MAILVHISFHVICHCCFNVLASTFGPGLALSHDFGIGRLAQLLTPLPLHLAPSSLPFSCKITRRICSVLFISLLWWRRRRVALCPVLSELHIWGCLHSFFFLTAPPPTPEWLAHSSRQNVNIALLLVELHPLWRPPGNAYLEGVASTFVLGSGVDRHCSQQGFRYILVLYGIKYMTILVQTLLQYLVWFWRCTHSCLMFVCLVFVCFHLGVSDTTFHLLKKWNLPWNAYGIPTPNFINLYLCACTWKWMGWVHN